MIRSGDTRHRGEASWGQRSPSPQPPLKKAPSPPPSWQGAARPHRWAQRGTTPNNRRFLARRIIHTPGTQGVLKVAHKNKHKVDSNSLWGGNKSSRVRVEFMSWPRATHSPRTAPPSESVRNHCTCRCPSCWRRTRSCDGR